MRIPLFFSEVPIPHSFASLRANSDTSMPPSVGTVTTAIWFEVESSKATSTLSRESTCAEVSAPAKSFTRRSG